MGHYCEDHIKAVKQARRWQAEMTPGRKIVEEMPERYSLALTPEVGDYVRPMRFSGKDNSIVFAKRPQICCLEPGDVLNFETCGEFRAYNRIISDTDDVQGMFSQKDGVEGFDIGNRFVRLDGIPTQIMMRVLELAPRESKKCASAVTPKARKPATMAQRIRQYVGI